MGESEVISEDRAEEKPVIRVLDQIGFVRLVDWHGSDLSIVRAARVSYNAEWRAGQDERSDVKLINSLITRGHTSPFEHVSLTFEVMAPIFVLRQWHRHRTQSYSEVSARYSELDLGFYVPQIDQIGEQSKKDKQGRDTEQMATLNPASAQSILRDHMMVSNKTYRQLLEMGLSRELARTVLPVAAYSHMFTTMNLLNFFRFAALRCESHAQYEIREYAHAMVKLVENNVAPHSVLAFKKVHPEVFGRDG